MEQYRSLSGAAVLALLLGLASVVALAHPAAWLVPALAFAFAIWALRRIRRRPESLMGGPLAMLGLVLSALFLSWAPTSYFGDQWLIRQQAREFGQEWIEAVLAGQIEKAHQATLVVRERQPFGTSLVEYYAQNDLRRAECDAYFDDGLARQLLDLGQAATCVYDGNLGVTYDRSYTLTSPRFALFRNGEPQPALRLQLEITREENDDTVYWSVVRLADATAVDQQLEAMRNR